MVNRFYECLIPDLGRLICLYGVASLGEEKDLLRLLYGTT